MITKRNIILFVSILIFVGINFFGTDILINTKIKTIESLEDEHKEENERYITAQILSKKLENVYRIFKNNLALNKKDKINEEASMVFLKELTDIVEKYEINLVQIIPGKKNTKGIYTKIPYVIELECDYEKFGNFIVELEKNKRLIMIDNIYLKNEIEKIKIDNKEDTSYLDQKIEMHIHTISLNKSKKL